MPCWGPQMWKKFTQSGKGILQAKVGKVLYITETVAGIKFSKSEPWFLVNITVQGIVQCLQYHMDYLPYQSLPHQNDMLTVELYIQFQVFLSLQFCDIHPGENRMPFKMNYNAYNSAFCFVLFFEMESYWCQVALPRSYIFLYLSFSSLSYLPDSTASFSWTYNFFTLPFHHSLRNTKLWV